jgi:hypothetical protein
LDKVPIPRNIPFQCLTDVDRAKAKRRSTIGMPDPRSLVQFVLGHAPVPERWVARSHWATVLFTPPPPPPLFDSDVRRFQQARGNELTLTENSMKQSGRTRRRALRVHVSGKESDGVRWVASCSWRLCQVTSSSGPPTALFTYTYSTHGQPRVQKKNVRCFLAYTESLGTQNTLHPPPDGLS